MQYIARNIPSSHFVTKETHKKNQIFFRCFTRYSAYLLSIGCPTWAAIEIQLQKASVGCFGFVVYFFFILFWLPKIKHVTSVKYAAVYGNPFYFLLKYKNSRNRMVTLHIRCAHMHARVGGRWAAEPQNQTHKLCHPSVQPQANIATLRNRYPYTQVHVPLFDSLYFSSIQAKAHTQIQWQHFKHHKWFNCKNKTKITNKQTKQREKKTKTKKESHQKPFCLFENPNFLT